MSQRLLLYYCALCGGGSAFLAWVLTAAIHLDAVESDLLHSIVLSVILGMTISGALGAVDSVFNASADHRLIRILGAVAFGLLGGVLAGMLCELLTKISPWLRFLGWMIVGIAIGVSFYLCDLVQSLLSRKPLGLRKARLTKGMIGGALGGGVGGLLFGFLDLTQIRDSLPRTSLVLSLVILGMGTGFFVGFAQLLLKEAWIKVESGFRPGRELILAKEQTTVGRAESCDLGLFGDASIDPVHARIERRGQSYFLSDGGSEGGTFLNNRRVSQPAKLHCGDLVRIGGSVLMFGERVKK